ncbi:hypothetical protein DEO72_LG2g3513 [Vigna unguiculata]|uniref:Uncharacterized protein n=1 Tax=Vigna unguiculata TaxID=3917 RepID=A0A4D6L3W6_VIGUN|nr:hypothetical protein DEO72_LG2g3513 [Vigna unguiculata]
MSESHDHSPSPAPADSPPHFNSIVMASLPESQDPVPQEAATDDDDPNDVNHAPMLTVIHLRDRSFPMMTLIYLRDRRLLIRVRSRG